MSRICNRTSILRAAATAALYQNTDGAGGAAPPVEPPKKEPEKKADEPKKIELTEAEIEARINARLKEREDAQAKEAKKAKQKQEEEEARKRGEFETLAQKEADKRAKAEEKAAAAERRAQLAEVNTALRDHLADKHPDYVKNATDIMLHVEKKLGADAKPEDVAKIIADESAAFVERTPRASAASGAPSGAQRGKLGADIKIEPPTNGNDQLRRPSFTASRC